MNKRIVLFFGVLIILMSITISGCELPNWLNKLLGNVYDPGTSNTSSLISTVEINPTDPRFPEEAGENDIVIRVNLLEDVDELSMVITDSNMNLQKQFLGMSYMAGTNYISWDSIDDEGNPVSDGDYICYVVAISGDSRQVESASFTINTSS